MEKVDIVDKANSGMYIVHIVDFSRLVNCTIQYKLFSEEMNYLTSNRMYKSSVEILHMSTCNSVIV